MGNGVGYPSASHLANLGLLPSSDEVRLRTSGTVTLKPVGSKQRLRLIRVSDGPHDLAHRGTCAALVPQSAAIAGTARSAERNLREANPDGSGQRGGMNQ